MKKLTVKYVEQKEINTYSGLQEIFKGATVHQIAEATWNKDYPNQPEVHFQIVYTSESIFIHYKVREDYIKAQYIRPNEAVWEDSCVEFFISFDQKVHYYNIEMNPLGTGLVGYGTADKDSRNRLTAVQIQQINTYTEVSSIKGQKLWNTILEIPFKLFTSAGTLVSADSLKGKSVHANFYKCGDGLPAPHFVSWNRIDFPTPNFHLPEFFGEISFE